MELGFPRADSRHGPIAGGMWNLLEIPFFSPIFFKLVFGRAAQEDGRARAGLREKVVEYGI